MSQVGIIEVEKGIYGRTSPKVSSPITGNIYTKGTAVLIISIESDGIREWAKIDNNEYLLMSSNGHTYIKLDSGIAVQIPTNTLDPNVSPTTTNTETGTTTEEEAQHQAELEEKIRKSEEEAQNLNGERITNLINAGYMDNRSNKNQLLKMKSMRLFGLPFQFTSWVDPRYATVSEAFGRQFLKRIVLNAPICTIIPGKPRYLSGLDDKDKSSITTALINAASDTFKPLQDAIKNTDDISNVQYYDFESDYNTYMNNVNLLCRSAAGFLELEGSKFSIDGTRLTQYDWRNYRWDADRYSSRVASVVTTVGGKLSSKFSTWIKNLSSSAASVFLGGSTAVVDDEGNVSTDSGSSKTEILFDGYDTEDDESTASLEELLREVNVVQFYVDPDSGVSESMSNSSEASAFKGLFDTGSSFLKELQFIGGTGNVDVQSALTSFSSAAGSYLSGLVPTNDFTSPIKRILGLGGNVLKGENIIMPDIYTSSTYTKSYSLTIVLKNLYGNRFGYYMEILVPILHLMALSFPSQASANSYKAPPIIKAFIPGVFSCNLGLISGITIDKSVSNESWTVDGLPNEVTVRLDIVDLYSSLTISPSTHPLLFAHNSSLVDYLSVSCGLDIMRPNFKKKFSMASSAIVSNIVDTPSNLVNRATDAIDKRVSKIMSGFSLVK